MAYCTDIVDSTAPAKPATSLLDWIAAFFRIRHQRRLALSELERLADRELRDIGVERRDIATIVDREMSKLRLDELRSRF